MGGMTSSALQTTGPMTELFELLVLGQQLFLLGFLLQGNYQPTGGGLLGEITIPFSKWFFSPAYCLLAAGTAMLLLVAFFIVIDLKRWTTAWWLRVWGMNALALYVAAELSFKMVFSKWLIKLPSGGSDSLASGFQAWVDISTGSPASQGGVL